MGAEPKKKGSTGRSRTPAIVPELKRSSSSESKSKNPPLIGSEPVPRQSRRKVDLVDVEDEAAEVKSLMVEEAEETAQREW